MPSSARLKDSGVATRRQRTEDGLGRAEEFFDVTMSAAIASCGAWGIPLLIHGARVQVREDFDALYLHNLPHSQTYNAYLSIYFLNHFRGLFISFELHRYPLFLNSQSLLPLLAFR